MAVPSSSLRVMGSSSNSYGVSTLVPPRARIFSGVGSVGHESVHAGFEAEGHEPFYQREWP
jgi:hypothetical protein